MTDHGSKKLRQQYQLPPLNAKLPPGWHRIKHPDYQDIQWTYSRNAPLLTCNGIKITEGYRYLIREEFFKIRLPRLSVFDFDANLPLNLQRTNLTQSQYPFHEELLNDVLKDFIASALVNAPIQPNLNTSTLQWLSDINYPGIYTEEIKSFFPWFSIHSGVSSYEQWHISQIQARQLLLVPTYYLSYHPRDIFIPNIILPSLQAAFVYKASRNFSKLDKARIFDEVIEISLGIHIDVLMPGTIDYFTLPGYRSLISRHVLNYIEEVSRFEGEDFLQGVTSGITEEWQNENWVLWRRGECPPTEFDFKKFAAENDGKNYDEWPCILAEWYFKDPKPQLEESKLSPVAKVWKEVVGSPIIPFDLEERRKMKAYEILKPYIDAHEKMKDS